MFDRLRSWFSSPKSSPRKRRPESASTEPWADLDSRPLSLSAMLAVANGRMNEAEIRAQAKAAASKLREANDTPAGVWASSFVDPFDLVSDNADFFPGLGSGGWGVPWTMNNMARGDVLPVYINEYGLKLIRDWSRRTLAFNEFAINAVENRISYIVGKGFQYCALPKKKPITSEQAVGGESGVQPDALAQKAQAVLDEFIDRERWNEREQECVRRCDRDGEAILRFFHLGGGRCAVRFVEPEHVTDTQGGADRQYGVVTAPHDIEDVTHYSIVTNPAAGWTTEDIPADRVLHIKANTDFDAKRGLPTLFPVRKNLERADKLLRNMSVMAQVQATFAVLRKHKQFAPSSVSAYQQGQGDLNSVIPASGRSLQMQQLVPGSIIDTSDKTQYEFPAASVNASGLVAVLQAELRAVCARMVMPEFMLTVDASNANFASTMVAEAPSVKNFERLQCWFGRRFGDGEYGRRDVGGGRLVGAMWRVLAIAVEAGLLPRETLTDIEIQVEGPTLVVRNKWQETARAKSLFEAGLLSMPTWAKWEGLDYAQEKQQGAKAKEQLGGGRFGGGAPPPSGPAGAGGGGEPRGPRDPAPPGSGGGDGGMDFFSESLAEEKDASGHEHAADGKFSTGGGGENKPYEKAKAEHGERQAARDKRRVAVEKLDNQIKASGAVTDDLTVRGSALIDAATEGNPSTAESRAEHAKALGDHADKWTASVGYRAGDYAESMTVAGVNAADVAAMKELGVKGRAAVGQAGDRLKRAVEKHRAAQEALEKAPSERAEPEEPSYDDYPGLDADENSPEYQKAEADFDAAYAAHEKDHGKWEKENEKRENLQDKADEASEGVVAANDRLEEVGGKWAEKIDALAAEASVDVEGAIQDEEDADPEPDEPDDSEDEVSEEVKRVFGKCIDTETHKEVPCPDAGDDSGKPAVNNDNPAPGGKTLRADPAHAKLAGEMREKLAGDIKAMATTPEGKATLAKGAELAGKVKSGLKAGVEKALSAVDAESKGGISLIAHGVKDKSVTAVAQGAASLFNSVFMCVHEEVFENALSQHSIPGAHAIGMVAASVAVKAEQGLLKAIAWSWSKLREEIELTEAEAGAELTDADKELLAHLARVASNAVAAIYREAGVHDVEVDADAAAKAILRNLRGGK